MADPADRRVVDEIEFVTGRRVFPYVALHDSLRDVIDKSYELAEAGEAYYVGPAVPDDYPTQPPANFSDVFTLAVGAQWQTRWGPWRLTPRGGVRFEPSPVPEQSGFHNYLDSARLVTGLGLGVERWGLRLDTGAQFNWMPPRGHDKTDLQPRLQNEITDRVEHHGEVCLWRLKDVQHRAEAHHRRILVLKIAC